jgi:hypothetical protein
MPKSAASYLSTYRYPEWVYRTEGSAAGWANWDPAGCQPEGCCCPGGVAGLEPGAGIAHPAFPADGSDAGGVAVWDPAGAGEGEALEPDEDAGAAEDEGAADAEASAAAVPVEGGLVRSLKQYRHLIASSWISSAQYGHFFTTVPPRSWPTPGRCRIG